MKKGDLLTLLAGRVGNRTDADLIAVLELELTLAQDTKLEQNGRIKPWFLTSEFATAVTTAGEQRLLLPADFLGEIEEGALYVLNPESGKYDEILRGDYDHLAEKYKHSDPGLPKHYTLESSKYYRLFPTPDLVYTIRQRYIEKDTPFNQVPTGEENRWMKFASDLLLAYGATEYATKHLRNVDAANLYAVDIPVAWDRLKHEHEMREHSNRDYEMGD